MCCKGVVNTEVYNITFCCALSQICVCMWHNGNAVRNVVAFRLWGRNPLSSLRTFLYQKCSRKNKKIKINQHQGVYFRDNFIKVTAVSTECYLLCLSMLLLYTHIEMWRNCWYSVSGVWRRNYILLSDTRMQCVLWGYPGNKVSTIATHYPT